MEKPLKMLAFDFGASSGRAILGILDNGKLTLEELHRFSNDPVNVGGSFFWDVLRLFHEIKQAITKCMNAGHRDISSIAVDTWGVDFGLLDEKGNLLGNPYHYRDSRTDGMMEKVFEKIPADELYSITGIQFMKLNSIFQLYSMKHDNSPILREARTLLFMPDLFNYFLTGVKATEYSIASTSQLLDSAAKTWSVELIRRLGLPEGIFTGIVPCGTVVGRLSPDIAKELGTPEIPVIAAAGHDTQAAVASVPYTDDGNYVYISSGTWSLMGVEIDRPVINKESKYLAFTNEGGVNGKISFLKNIMGLWLVQECKRQWEREGDNVSFARLEQMADEARPFEAFIDPDDELFIAPGGMPERIRNYCKKTGQKVPETKGEVVRCIVQSLAMKYRLTLESLETVLGRELPVIHVVGGGTKDRMLCRFAANATGCKVIAGPIEATAIGNIVVQAMASGMVKGLSEARAIVKNSFPLNEYLPEDTDAWRGEYPRFRNVTGL